MARRNRTPVELSVEVNDLSKFQQTETDERKKYKQVTQLTAHSAGPGRFVESCVTWRQKNDVFFLSDSFSPSLTSCFFFAFTQSMVQIELLWKPLVPFPPASEQQSPSAGVLTGQQGVGALSEFLSTKLNLQFLLSESRPAASR